MDTRRKSWMAGWPHNWTEWTNLLLGLWLIVSPFVLGPGASLVATGSFVGFGLVIAILAVYALARPESWEEGVNIIVGLCLAVSPWLFAFTTERLQATHAVIAGLAVVALAVWSLMRDLPGDHWWHHHHRPH